MKKLTIHIVAQFIFVFAVVFDQDTVEFFNKFLGILGVYYKDSHVDLGVYVAAVFVILYPVSYFLWCEYSLKKQISKHINYWFFRSECLLLLTFGIFMFFS